MCVKSIIIIWSIISSIIIFAIFHFSHYLLELTFNGQNVLIGMSQILATIFAITFSITLIGINYFTERVIPNFLIKFLRRKFIIILISINVFTILFLTISSIVLPNNFCLITISFIFFNLSILFLIYYIYYISDYLRSNTLLNEINQINKDKEDIYLKEISKVIRDTTQNKLKSEMLKYGVIPNSNSKALNTINYDLSQIIFRSIKDNDIDSFDNGLKKVDEIRKSFIDKSLKLEDAKKIKMVINNDFSYIYSRIFFEILNNENPIFFESYLKSITNITNELIDKDDSSLSTYIRLIIHIGEAISKSEYPFYDIYLPQIANILRNMLKYFLFQNIEFIPKFFQLNKLYINMAYKNIYNVELTSKIKDYLTLLILYIFTDLRTLKESYVLSRTLYLQLSKIQRKQIENNIEISFFGDLNIEVIFSGMPAAYSDSVGIEFLSLFVNDSVEATKRKLDSGIEDLCYNLNRPIILKNPKYANIIIDGIIDCFKSLSDDDINKIDCFVQLNLLSLLKKIKEIHPKDVDIILKLDKLKV